MVILLQVELERQLSSSKLTSSTSSMRSSSLKSSIGTSAKCRGTRGTLPISPASGLCRLSALIQVTSRLESSQGTHRSKCHLESEVHKARNSTPMRILVRGRVRETEACRRTNPTLALRGRTTPTSTRSRTSGPPALTTAPSERTSRIPCLSSRCSIETLHLGINSFRIQTVREDDRRPVQEKR